MKNALLLTLLMPALCAASCGTSTVTETKSVYVTCTAGAQDCGAATTGLVNTETPKSSPAATSPVTSTPEPSSGVPSSPAPAASSIASSSASGGLASKPAPTYNPLPDAAIQSSDTPSVFLPLQSVPDKVIIMNSCTYDITLHSVGCGAGVTGQVIAAGDTYTESLRSCEKEGTALHVTSKQHDKPVMVEYGAGKQGMLYYDLSFLDCMIPQTTNLTGCAGWKEGHQCQGGQGSHVMACLPGEYCDRSSYTVAEYGLTEENKPTRKLVPAPIAATTYAVGLIWELCAGNRGPTGGK